MKSDLAALLDTADAGILITDKHGRVLFANTTFRRLSGCAPGVGLGKTRMHELQMLLERAATPVQPGAGIGHFRQQEREHILKAIHQTNGKIYGPDGAAALLGLPPTTLVSRLRKYGFEPKRRRRRLELPVPQASLPATESDMEILLD